MRKRYNIFIISRLYLLDYYKFVVKETNITKSSDALQLFMYSMKKLYDLDTVEYCEAICKYGDECVERLSKTEGTPTVRSHMSYEDKVKLVSVCEGYACATNLLSHKNIVNNRLKEG